MGLREEFENIGNWLFRWRSYLPLLIIPILLIALRESEYLELLFGDYVENFWEAFCVVLSFIGLTIRCVTIGYVPKGTSGRNTRNGQVAETLNTTGMYSIVRHPLYLGNFFIFLGIILFIQVLWFGIFAIFAFWLYYLMIMFAEEEFLRKKFGDKYLQWSSKTPTFIPRFSKWQHPSLSFSFRNVLKREYTTFFLITTSFSILDIVADLFGERKLEIDLFWIIFFVVGLIIYVILRTIKKKTKILEVEGR